MNTTDETTSLRVLDKTGHLVICGWSLQGRRAIEDLRTTAPDLSITVVSQIGDADVPTVPDQNDVTHLSADPTSWEALQQAGIEEAQVGVLLTDRSYSANTDTLDSRTLLTALTIREYDTSIHLIAELADDNHRQLAADAGIDETIMADRFSGVMLSQSLQSPGLAELFTRLFETAAGAVLEERPVPDELVGVPFSRALGRGPALGLGAVAGLRRRDDLMLPPSEDLDLQSGDLLLAIRRL